jgi:hypothetical protein
MQGARKLIAPLFSVVLISACQQQRSDQNIMIDNNVVSSADVEAVPPDESSATPTDELVNGVDEDAAAANSL